MSIDNNNCCFSDNIFQKWILSIKRIYIIVSHIYLVDHFLLYY